MQHCKIISFLWLFVILMAIDQSKTFGFDDQKTHSDISLLAIRSSDLNDYLTNNLSIREGLAQRLYSNLTGEMKPILEWLRKGSIDEDTPTCRAANHFHNPLAASWAQAFMSDDTTPLGILSRYGCESDGWPYSERKSNLTWATGYSSVGGAINPRPKQEMGWDDARRYYYSALTSLSKTNRDTYFIKTFQALGQVLHLIQDMAVPAHTRNDFTAHLVFQGMESINPVSWFGNPYEYYVKNHAGIVNRSQVVFPGLINPRVTEFWDTDIYTGYNQLAGLPIGLAELTHAGYFSDSTIPNNAPRPEHSFPQPSLSMSNYQICEDYSEDLTEVKKYISRKEKGPCPPLSGERRADHFAVVSIIEDPVLREENIPTLKLQLDDNVHQTYAGELIPHAIGYSAKLIDYFFRGKLQVTAAPIIFRNSLHFMRLKIKNLSDETMSQGEFALMYRYTPPGGNADGSDDVFKPAWEINGAALVPCIELRGQQEMVVDFRLDSPLPKNDYEAIKFTLAFRGKLGNEPDAVIGKTFSPGYVIFEEEWDRPLPGSYGWAHTGYNWDSHNPANGVSTNVIAEDMLAKRNIRSAGSPLGRVNESFLGDGIYRPPMPLNITPNTYLIYKIDEMYMEPLNPEGAILGHQFMMLSFTDLLTLQISQPGQMEGWNSWTAYYTFNPTDIVVDNIYESFQRAGITIPGDFALNFLSLAQRWYELPEGAGADHEQRMRIEFIQLVEANVE